MLELNIEAACCPNYDLPALQSITLTARSPEGAQLSTLKALRFADAGFDIGCLNRLVDAFDEHTSVAYHFALELSKLKRSLRRRFAVEGMFACGLIAVLDIRTTPLARGSRIGIELLNYLRKLHAGMEWFVALQAAPQEEGDFDSPDYMAMRKRLIQYYKSDNSLGLAEVAPNVSAGVLMAIWR